MHKNPKSIGGGQIEAAWSLDDVVYSATVKEKEQDIKDGKVEAEGVYIRELILEGARWQRVAL